MQKEVAQALGLLNEDAFWMPRTKRPVSAKATFRRRPGHMRRPFEAEDTGSWGGEEHDMADSPCETPYAKRQRTAEAADLPEMAGAELL